MTQVLFLINLLRFEIRFFPDTPLISIMVDTHHNKKVRHRSECLTLVVTFSAQEIVINVVICLDWIIFDFKICFMEMCKSYKI